jgi:DNA helicase-2/ATP-dependent DNA helicase PcrA
VRFRAALTAPGDAGAGNSGEEGLAEVLIANDLRPINALNFWYGGMFAYAMNLTQSQQNAVNHGDSNLQLIACAGSGKTEVIARRVAHLIKRGSRPSNIIAFTFTEKAAAELKERIVSRCREEIGEIHGMAEMYIGTSHAFCLDLLTAEVPKYLKFEVLNEVQQALFIDRYSNKSGLTTSTDLAGQPLKRYTDTQRYLSAISILREADTDDNVLKTCSVLKGLESYRSLLDETRHLDYSAIIEAAVDVLNFEPGLKERLAERVKHIIVDEYQDLNPIQEAIVWSLHELGATVCVVGDDDH